MTRAAALVIAVLLSWQGDCAIRAQDDPRSAPNPAVRPAASGETRGRAAGWGQGRTWLDQHNDINDAAKAGEPIDLVLLGDSITQSWGGPGRSVGSPGGAAREKYFGACRHANFGISGDRTEHLLWRIDHGNFDGIAPCVIVLMIGTNNLSMGHTPEQVAEGIEAVIRRLGKKTPASHVVLVGVLPRGEGHGDPYREKVRALNALLGSRPLGSRVTFRDMSPVFLEENGTARADLFSGDFLHLRPAGYAAWAAALSPMVDSLLDDRVPARTDGYPRNSAIDIEHYAFTLELSDETDTVAAEAELVVDVLEEGVAGVVLDLVGRTEGSETGMTVSSVRSGERSLSFEHEGHRLRIGLADNPRPGDERRITVTYSGRPADGLLIADNKFGDRTFFGDNWPDRARHWLPTIDHPHDKATCEFVVTAPDRYRVVANGRRIEESHLPGGRCLTHWVESVPITTYCMVIGAARFAVQSLGSERSLSDRGGVPIETWVYPQNRNAGFFDFASAPQVVAFFSDRVGPFPYEKLANVQSRTRYGGTENASVIFYNERSVTGTGKSANLITHEITHQWFGDSVTADDWHHIWLSEGFATYFTHLYNEATHGRDRLEAGLRRDRRRVVSFFERRPGSPVVDTTITVLDDLLSANSYQKGSWVLHMLRREVGDQAFWSGIRAYYAEFRDRTAMTSDFVRVMEKASGRELDRFFEQWIFEPGHPVLEGTWTFDDGVLAVNLRQTQEAGSVFVFPLEIGITNSDGDLEGIETVRVDERSEAFSFTLAERPGAVRLDPRTWLLVDTRSWIAEH